MKLIHVIGPGDQMFPRRGLFIKRWQGEPSRGIKTVTCAIDLIATWRGRFYRWSACKGVTGTDSDGYRYSWRKAVFGYDSGPLETTVVNPVDEVPCDEIDGESFGGVPRFR